MDTRSYLVVTYSGILSPRAVRGVTRVYPLPPFFGELGAPAHARTVTASATAPAPPRPGSPVSPEREDEEVAEFLRCRCDRWTAANPCDREFTAVDGFCDDCRPRCIWGWPRSECCGMGISCALVPLVGTDRHAHVRQDLI